MKLGQIESNPPRHRGWTNRIITLSLIGIIFLTFLPFRFDFTRTLPGNGSHFLLDRSLNFESPLHFSLNVLLFVPLGFGLASLFRDRKNKWGSAFLWTGAIGFISSYSIEFLQVYIPGRNSAWDDVLTNAIGALVGFLVFSSVGPLAIELLSNLESLVQERLTIPWATIVLAAYFTLWLLISAHLQHETRLTNWDSSAWLNVGTADRDQRPWNGQVHRLEIWSKSMSLQEIRGIDLRGSPGLGTQDPFAFYEVSDSSPYPDRLGRLPSLSTAESNFPSKRAGSSGTGEHSGLSTNTPVTLLIDELQRTSQFTIRILCVPVGNEKGSGEIVSISTQRGVTDFALRQDGLTLEMELRTGLESRRSRLTWAVPDVFKRHGPLDIVISYDGSWASLYVDGQKLPNSYHLGPGASLVRRFIRIKTAELNGYFVLYDMLVFMPIGFVAGIATRRNGVEISSQGAWICACTVLPAILFEVVLISVSGRALSIGLIGMSAAFTVVGYIFINLDHEVLSPSPR